MKTKNLKAEYYGTLPLANIKLTCAVLEDETRVISERSLANAFGIRGSGAYWEKKKALGAENVLPEYISIQNIEKFVSKALREKLSKSITYIPKGSREEATGFSAEVLPDICDVWIQAKEAGALTKSQEKVAENAYILLRGFAAVGIIALIDEATGFQDVRKKGALQKILDKYLRKEYAAWAKCFPDEFYEEIFRLKGWTLDKKTMRMPGVVGRYTNDIVYDRLAPGIFDELKKRNPVQDNGKRKSKHHSWLTQETGHPALDKHFTGILALMRANTDWEHFKRSLERAYPKIGTQSALKQLAINFNDDDK